MYIYVPCSVEASPLHLGSRWLTLFLHWWMHGRWLMVMAHSLVIDMLLCLIDNIVVLLARGKARDKFVLREIATFSFYLFFPANDGFWINLHVFIPYIFLSFSLSDFRGFQQPITTTPYPALPYHAPAGKQVKAADQAGSASVKLEPMSTNQTVAYSSQSQPCVFDSCLVSDAYVVCVFDFMFLFGCAWCVCAWVLVWGSLSFSLTTFFCLLVFFLMLVLIFVLFWLSQKFIPRLLIHIHTHIRTPSLFYATRKKEKKSPRTKFSSPCPLTRFYLVLFFSILASSLLPPLLPGRVGVNLVAR